jgi:DHA2 family multidrug resistance protein
MVIARLTSGTQFMHARLGEYLTPFNNALQSPDVMATLNPNTDTGRAMLDAILTQQATVIAYQNDFKLLTYLTLATLPLLLVLGTTRKKEAGAAETEEIHVME